MGRDGCQADETLTLGEHVLRIESILPLCRKGVDFYGPTVLVDILVFLYLVVFYPTTVSSTVQDLAESVTQNQVRPGPQDVEACANITSSWTTPILSILKRDWTTNSLTLLPTSDLLQTSNICGRI